jgi:hypothetical protein
MAAPSGPKIPKIGNGGLSPAAKERRRKEALPGSGVGRTRTSISQNPPPPKGGSRSAGANKAAQRKAR